MQAIMHDRYGSADGLQLRDIDIPDVAEDGVLVRVRAASVNAFDWHIMRGLPYIARAQEGLRAPKQQQLGVDVAGQVEAVGQNVTQFRPGDAVFGWRRGAFAEYVCGTAHTLAPLPADCTFEQAAAVPLAGITALQALRDKGQAQPGQRVLIDGAAGGVGTFAVQLAKACGAHVTGVCRSAHLETIRGLGADEVLDYTQEDFTRGAQRYDLILDIAANHSLAAHRRALTPNGRYVLVGAPRGQWVGPLARPLAALALSRMGSKSLLPLMATFKLADLLTLREFIEAGQLTPVIDRVFPLCETADAIRYLETGHPRGKVVIAV
jgi:NADPH:quinone reductase-like Zn-dependent oxidoreductase